MVRPSSLLVKTAHKHNVHGLIPLLHVIPCLYLYKGLKMPQNIYLKRRNTGFIQRNKSYENKFISVYDFNNPLQNKKHFTVPTTMWRVWSFISLFQKDMYLLFNLIEKRLTRRVAEI